MKRQYKVMERIMPCRHVRRIEICREGASSRSYDNLRTLNYDDAAAPGLVFGMRLALLMTVYAADATILSGACGRSQGRYYILSVRHEDDVAASTITFKRLYMAISEAYSTSAGQRNTYATIALRIPSRA